MKQKELTKTFMVISNQKRPLVPMAYKQIINISALLGLIMISQYR